MKPTESGEFDTRFDEVLLDRATQRVRESTGGPETFPKWWYTANGSPLPADPTPTLPDAQLEELARLAAKLERTKAEWLSMPLPEDWTSPEARAFREARTAYKAAKSAYHYALTPATVAALVALARRGAATWEQRFDRLAANTPHLTMEYEDGAAWVAWYDGCPAANGQATAAECFDAAMDEVWGDGGTMRPEFAARLREHRAARSALPERTDHAEK